MATIHWAYIQHDFSGTNVVRASDSAISVLTVEPGHDIVTFPSSVDGCTATICNSMGRITAIPGDQTDLAANQVRVTTFFETAAYSARDFTIVSYTMTE